MKILTVENNIIYGRPETIYYYCRMTCHLYQLIFIFLSKKLCSKNFDNLQELESEQNRQIIASVAPTHCTAAIGCTALSSNSSKHSYSSLQRGTAPARVSAHEQQLLCLFKAKRAIVSQNPRSKFFTSFQDDSKNAQHFRI